MNFESQLFPESTRGRIVAVLRRGAATVDDIASELGLSDNAVRVQLTRMERDVLVRRVGLHRRTTRPSHLYELTPAVIQLLSRAYVPFLTAVIRTISARHTPKELQSLMRDAGKELAEGFRPHVASLSSLSAQATAASEILNKEFGALTTVERVDGQVAIRGHGCPLAALTGTHPGVCLALESLLATLLERRVRQCCSQKHPPECCFIVSGQGAGRRTTK